MAAKPRAEAAAAYPLTVRLSPAERDLAARAAKTNHQSMSGFVRDSILTAAGDCLEDVPPPAKTP